MTAGSGELRFVASQDLGPLGTTEASPVECAWRWLYHLPYLGLWALLAGALVVPKENRKGQAWLILVPLFLVLALWKMPVTLIRMPSSSANFLGLLLASLAVAWTVVWLVGPRLRRRGRPASLLWAWGAMLLVGALSFFGDRGVGAASPVVGFVSEGVPFLLTFGAFTFVLLLAMRISRLSCRRRYRPGPFMGWLFLWLLLTCAVGISLWCGVMLIVVGASLIELPMILAMGGVGSAFIAVLLYLVNLPFMILAFKSPFYRERFQRTFGLETSTGESPFRPDAPDHGNAAPISCPAER